MRRVHNGFAVVIDQYYFNAAVRISPLSPSHINNNNNNIKKEKQINKSHRVFVYFDITQLENKHARNHQRVSERLHSKQSTTINAINTKTRGSVRKYIVIDEI